MLVRSAPIRGVPPCMPGVDGMPDASTLALRMLRGRLSRLPPHKDDGARARTEASVSMERRRRRLLEDASVRMEALSVRRLLAVADWYVVGFVAGARCAGIAEAGDAVGKGWLNWMACELGGAAGGVGTPGGAMDCIVVSVVVRDRTDGAGLEKVLSPLRLESTPPPMVRLVPARELAPWLGAVMDRAPS
jgi:hypothetical protein